MTDILDEVEGDYRAEQLRALAMRYAWLAGAVLLLVLIGAGGWQYRQARQARAEQAAATQFLQLAKAADALTPGEAAAAIPLAARLERFAATAPSGYRTLARLRAAAVLAGAGKLAEAQAQWDRVSTDPDADPPLRQLASLLWVQRGLDRADPAALRTRLVSLTGPDDAYRPLALEAEALLDLRQRQPDAARAVLRRLSADPATPSGVRGRDGALLARLGG